MSDRPKIPGSGGGTVPPPTFRNLVTELASTALVCLGVITSPITRQKSADPERAKHLIDLLAMLHRKTLGNLEPMEDDYLNAVIEDLRAKYAGLTGTPLNSPDDEPDEPDEPGL